MRQVFGILLMLIGVALSLGTPIAIPGLPLNPAAPATPDAKKPDDGRRKIFPLRKPMYVPEAAAKGGVVSPDGTEEINCDLPARLHLKNRGGSDRAGLCVFASLKHSSLWQHQWVTQGIFEWMWDKPGGGWPEKVDSVIAKMAQQQGKPKPTYVQIQNKDIEVLKLACKTGRMPGVTYNYSPTGNYRGMIDHMVSLVHASDRWFAVLDNNYPGQIEWMDPDTFKSVYTRRGTRNGWAVIFLDPGPPPPPKNL